MLSSSALINPSSIRKYDNYFLIGAFLVITSLVLGIVMHFYANLGTFSLGFIQGYSLEIPYSVLVILGICAGFGFMAMAGHAEKKSIKREKGIELPEQRFLSGVTAGVTDRALSRSFSPQLFLDSFSPQYLSLSSLESMPRSPSSLESSKIMSPWVLKRLIAHICDHGEQMHFSTEAPFTATYPHKTLGLKEDKIDKAVSALFGHGSNGGLFYTEFRSLQDLQVRMQLIFETMLEKFGKKNHYTIIKKLKARPDYGHYIECTLYLNRISTERAFKKASVSKKSQTQYSGHFILMDPKDKNSMHFYHLSEKRRTFWKGFHARTQARKASEEKKHP